MALIDCPECGKQISDKAQECNSCGCPIEAAKESGGSGANLTTIQGTSKRLKMHTLLASLTLIVGVVWLIGEPKIPGQFNPAPVFLIFGGFIWVIVSRVRTWWHHS